LSPLLLLQLFQRFFSCRTLQELIILALDEQILRTRRSCGAAGARRSTTITTTTTTTTTLTTTTRVNGSQAS
jgi:hypothetical protein